jgi:hypothetical protein
MKKLLIGLLVGLTLFIGVDVAYAQAFRTGGGGGLSQAAADLLYCALSGCTMTGSTVYSGVATDITTVGNETLTIDAAGAGAITLADTVTLTTAQIRSAGSDSIYLAGGANHGVALFRVTDQAFSSRVACMADSGAATTGTNQQCFYGEGLRAVERRQAATCTSDGTGAAGALNLTPSSEIVLVTNADPDGCVVTMVETSAVVGADSTMIVISTAGGVVTFPDVANVHDGPTFATTTGLGLNDSYTVHYADAANDLYVGVGTSDN